MKKLIVATIALAASIAAHADDLNLYVYGTAGTTTYAFNDLYKLTFSNGNLVITTKTGTSTTVALNSIQQMHFNTAEAESVELTPADQQKEELYDMAGRKVNTTAATAAPGLYIVKKGNKTQKMLKR